MYDSSNQQINQNNRGTILISKFSPKKKNNKKKGVNYMRWFWISILAGTVLSNPAKVTAITYNEAVSGDLSTNFQQPNPNIFNLDVGTNTFFGELSFSNNNTVQTDFDDINFRIPTETQLESILLDIALLPEGFGIFDKVEYQLFPFNGPFPNTPDQLAIIPSSNVNLFTSILPLELKSNVFVLENTGLGGRLPPEGFRVAAYTLSLNVVSKQVETIPEPNFIKGLLALGIYGLTLVFKKNNI